MPTPEQTSNWQRISFVPSIAEMVDGRLDSAQDIHVMQLDDLRFYEE